MGDAKPEVGPPLMAGPPALLIGPAQYVGQGARFPPMEQINSLESCIHSNPRWWYVVILGFLHFIVMLGSVVLYSGTMVPLMGGNDKDKARVIQTFLLVSSVNTFLQTMFGSRLPTVMSVSFVFIVPVMSIIRDVNSSGVQDRFGYTMRTIQGSLIISSLLNIVLGFSTIWARFTKRFSPVSVVPVVCLVGLGLSARGFPQVGKCVEIGLPMLILSAMMQYLKLVHDRAKLHVERLWLLPCVIIVWGLAGILTAAGAYNHAPEKTRLHCRIRFDLVSSADWFRVPYPFQWGSPVFKASHVFGMMAAVVVAAAESTGANIAAARMSGATPPPPYVLTRSVGWQGVGMLMEGFFGAAGGSTVAVENIGFITLTRIGSRKVIQTSCVFMFFFALFGKFGAFFATIPLPIFAAMYCLFFGAVSACGVSFMQFMNNNNTRNLYVIGTALFLGLSIPQYFNEYTATAGRGPARSNAGWFNDILNTLFSSAPAVAMIVGTVLDNTMEVDEHESERGLPWWEPFQNDIDARNQEFYGFPFNQLLNDLIHARYRR